MTALRRSTMAFSLAAALALACSSSAPPGGVGGAGGDDTGGSGGAGGDAGAGGGGSGGGGAGGTTKDAAGLDSAAAGTGDDGMPDAAPEMAPDSGAADLNDFPDVPGAGGPFTLGSSAFKEGDTLPAMYRCPPDGNISPPLSWTAGPPGTKSYAVTLAHGTNIHWQLWDIPIDVTSIPMNVAKVAMPPVPAGAKQSQTSMSVGYFGPCPTSTAVSMYPYTVLALKVATLPGVTTTSTPKAIADALKANTIGTAVLTVNGHK